jgi:SlyX protein
MEENRLIDIETKLAHQEVLISELNQVIATQQATLNELTAGLKGFFKRYKELDDGNPIGPADQKPPHY